MIDKRQTGLLGIAAVAVLFGASAMAGEQPTAETAEGSSQDLPVSFNGVQVHVDPVTGRLRAPTAAEQQALSRAIRQDIGAPGAFARGRPVDEIAARATLRTSRTGQVGALVQLPQSHLNFLAAERQADGSISIQHQQEHAHADDAAHTDVEGQEVDR